jgi:hypothetical protein
VDGETRWFLIVGGQDVTDQIRAGGEKMMKAAQPPRPHPKPDNHTPAVVSTDPATRQAEALEEIARQIRDLKILEKELTIHPRKLAGLIESLNLPYNHATVAVAEEQKRAADRDLGRHERNRPVGVLKGDIPYI